MDNLYKSRQPYEERIFSAIKNGSLTAPLFFSIDPGKHSWDEATRHEITQRLWHTNHSMQFSDEGYVWYKSLQTPFTITDPTFATAGAILGIVRIFPTTAFHLHRNSLHHWDRDKQSSWALCGGSLSQWLSLNN
jgi:hypothetical protein